MATPSIDRNKWNLHVPYEILYRDMVGMALAAGWRRVNGWGQFWHHPLIPGSRRLGQVIEKIESDHGVDLRVPVPGEEA